MPSKVLVVEDDAEFLQLLQFMLEQAGYLPLLATTAEAALRWLDDPGGRPDAVLLDIGLPDPKMDGLDLCKAIKRNAGTHRLPVLVLTGRTDNASRIRAAQSHADMVLTKPVGQADLLEGLRSVLELPRAARRGILQKAGLQLDPLKRTVFFHGQTLYDLGQRLFDVLYLLAEHAPNALSQRFILASLGLVERDQEVYVMVSRLRARLRKAFGQDLVATVPGRGYRLEIPVLASRHD